MADDLDQGDNFVFGLSFDAVVRVRDPNVFRVDDDVDV